MTIWMLALLACSDAEKETEDTANNDQDTDDSGDSGDTSSPPPPPFVPAEGHWTYSGGELIAEQSTCVLGEENSDVTDPIGFTLALQDTIFTIASDDSSGESVNCSLNDPSSPEPGAFTCANTMTTVIIEDVWEDDFGQSANIEMQIDTASQGVFISNEELVNTFTLTLTCLDVDYWISDVDCSNLNDDNDGDGNPDYPTPCTITFNANATLD